MAAGHGAQDAARPPQGGVDDHEVARFAAMAAEWWDANGPFRPLHRINPVRLRFLSDRLAAHFGRDPLGPAPLRGLRIVDIGCGGGLLSEPLARLGGRVLGIDVADENITVARRHAEETGTEVEYRFLTAEALVAEGLRFDAVVALEVIEHVPSAEAFVATCAQLLAPGGAVALATLNRTALAFATAIVGAEYLLGWLPRGTHDWHRFVRPSELARALRANGVALRELVGVEYNPLTNGWALGPSLAVNYMAFGTTR